MSRFRCLKTLPWVLERSLEGPADAGRSVRGYTVEIKRYPELGCWDRERWDR